MGVGGESAEERSSGEEEAAQEAANDEREEALLRPWVLGGHDLVALGVDVNWG
jgi:hypothetical protein